MKKNQSKAYDGIGQLLIPLIALGILILFNLEESADWVMITVGIITILSGTLDLSKAIVAYRVSKRFS